MNVNTSISLDADTKRQATEVLNELGLNLSSAINIFLKQVVRQQAIPFPLALYPEDQYEWNEDSIKAFEEVEDIIKHPENYKSYTDVHQMMEDLLK